MINIKADSRKIKKGDIFIALRGFSSDGHDYIDKAIQNGASKLIVMDKKDYSIPYEVVEDTRVYLENYLKDNYSKYLEEMNIIGITGTNGKTTTAYLIYEILNKLGSKCAYIGTIGYYLEEGKVLDLPNTSQDICELYELIINAYDKGYRNIAIEVSSQGLVRGRLNTVPFKYTVFTNLTPEHLDEHKTMENYASAKKMLFDMNMNSLSIINYDDEYKDYFKTNRTLYYGFNGGDYKVTSYTLDSNGTTFKYIHNNNEYEVESPLLGKYNIYNLLSAVIILEDLKYDLNDIFNALKDIKSPDGRTDIVKYNSNTIIIDYAHTPDAMNNIINMAKSINHNNLYIVFGCTGSRDKSKRPVMMKMATDNATQVIVTVDDPHEEEPKDIFKDMLSGNTNTNYEIEEDRGLAIEKGISLLKDNDILLILGKGHEQFIVYKDHKLPFNDKKKVEEIINK